MKPLLGLLLFFSLPAWGFTVVIDGKRYPAEREVIVRPKAVTVDFCPLDGAVDRGVLPRGTVRTELRLGEVHRWRLESIGNQLTVRGSPHGGRALSGFTVRLAGCPSNPVLPGGCVVTVSNPITLQLKRQPGGDPPNTRACWLTAGRQYYVFVTAPPGSCPAGQRCGYQLGP